MIKFKKGDRIKNIDQRYGQQNFGKYGTIAGNDMGTIHVIYDDGCIGQSVNPEEHYKKISNRNMIKYIKNLFGIGEVDYKIDCVYDYIDTVEDLIDMRLDTNFKEVSNIIDKERVSGLSIMFAIAVALKIKPSVLAKNLTKNNMMEYLDSLNVEIDKINTQKKKSVK